MASIKKSLAETVCQNLRESISASKWRGTLPGIRTQCEEIGVSRQTMVTALRLLEADGYVLPARAGKPREIHSDILDPTTIGAGDRERNEPVVAVITWKHRMWLSQTDEQICSDLQQLLTAADFCYHHLVFPDITRARGAKRIENFIEQNPADIYIVMGAHPLCSQKINSVGVPTVFIGGEPVPDSYPRISYSFADMCRVAMNEFVAKGHRRICVLLPESLSRSKRIETKAELQIEAIFHSHSLPFSTYNCPRWGKTREEFKIVIQQIFALTPPTALILGDDIQMPRLVSFMMKNGLKFPDDISLVVLDEAPELQEYDPPISSVTKSTQSLAKLTLKAVKRGLKSNSEKTSELIIVPAKLVVTDSIAEISS